MSKFNEHAPATPDATQIPCPAEAANRFALASFDDEGVLLDLQRGAFYRINRVAKRICRGLLDGQEPDAIARELGRATISPTSAPSRMSSPY